MVAHSEHVPVIIGPTAVGKTAVAEAVGRLIDVVVVSADSRQVYRRLDIGTAKPTATTLASVPHVGLDVVDPGESFSAGQFARAIPGWLERMDASRRVLVVGGTGFYIKAVTDGLFEEPRIDRERRERLRAWMRTQDDVERWAERLDPGYHGNVRRRAARAVEVALLTGYPLSWWHRESPGRPIFRPWFFRLTLSREALYDRIQERVHEMLNRGWIDEVDAVLTSGVSPAAKGLDAVGYREIVLHLTGEVPEQALVERITQSTRRYAKRQETWFNHQLGHHPITLIDAIEPPSSAAERIVDVWSGRSR